MTVVTLSRVAYPDFPPGILFETRIETRIEPRFVLTIVTARIALPRY